MANIIELHMLRTFGVNSANRGEFGETKSCVVGGVKRARFSSQSIKAEVRNGFHDSYRTRHLADETLFSRFKEEYPDVTEEQQKAVLEAFEALCLTSSKEQVVVYSEKEADKIYEWVVEKYLNGEIDKAAEDLKKDSGKEHVFETIRSADIGLDVAIFGRMSTAGAVYTVPSATGVNHAYSIDENESEEDYFAAFDNVINQAGHLNGSSFSTNTMYSYFRIDPVQVYNNLMHPYENLLEGEKEKKKEEIKMRTADGVALAVEAMFNSVPGGKQNSMASHPMPAVIYATMDPNAINCTFDSCFNNVIRYHEGKSIAAQGTERLMKYAAETADKHEYRCFFIDNNLQEEISEDVFKEVKEDGISCDTIRNRSRLLDDIKVYVNDALKGL